MPHYIYMWKLLPYACGTACGDSVSMGMGAMLLPSGPLMGPQVDGMWEVGALHRHLVFHGNPMRLRDTRHMTVISGPPFSCMW
jgi:hypothetical protein